MLTRYDREDIISLIRTELAKAQPTQFQDHGKIALGTGERVVGITSHMGVLWAVTDYGTMVRIQIGDF